MQELERAEIIKAYTNGEIKASVAATRLQISTRQVRRLQQRFVEGGVSGMMSGRRGKPSNNRLAPELAQKAVNLIREHYPDFAPTFACEMLNERHGLTLSRETLRRLMIEAGLWTPRAARQGRLHQPRERRASFGELVQIDGSRHEWFEGRAPACALLAYVDDATGRILQLHFAETESTASYFEATKGYLERHGRPQTFYSDRAAVFRSAAEIRHTPTQFQRALDDLGINLICAKSAQAKGRVERLNRTLQDRLVKTLRIDGINSIETANRWTTQYIENYNKRFALAPSSTLDLHQPLRSTDDLARILALLDVRKLTTKLTLQHSGKLYLLKDEARTRALIGQKIAVHTYADGRIELRANGEALPYTTLEQPKRFSAIEVDSKTLHYAVDELQRKPKRNRPHRQSMPAQLVANGVAAAKKMSAPARR